MNEHDDVLLINQAFARFTTEAGTAVRAPGANGVRDTVMRRHRARVTALAVTAIIAVVAPATAYAVAQGGGRASVPAGSATSGAPATPGPSATPSPSSSPSASASAAVGGTPISLDDLTAAPVGVPRWPWSGSDQATCASGRVRLAPVAQVAGSRVGVVALVGANLDDDPALETAALLRCGYGAEQVVAFDRDQAGTIITLGQVAASTPAMQAILAIKRRAPGGVDATVADVRVPADQRRQTRSYAWNGIRFVQVAGPTSFPTHPVDLGLAVGTPVAGTVSGSCQGALRDVSVTFTVTNHSTYASGPFYLLWRGGAFLPTGSYAGPYWLDTPGHPARNGGHAGLKPGERVNLRFQFKIDACVTDWGFTTGIVASTADPDPSNDNVTWWLRIR